MAALESAITRLTRSVRDYADDIVDSTKWTGARILRLLEQSNIQVHDDIVRSSGVYSNYGLAQKTITLTNGENEYSLPPNFKKAVALVKLHSTEEYIESEIFPTTRDSRRSGFLIDDPRQGFLQLTEEWTGGTETWTLYYIARPPDYLATLSLPGGHVTNAADLVTNKIDVSEATTPPTITEGTWLGTALPEMYLGSWIRVLDAAVTPGVSSTGHQAQIVAATSSQLNTKPIDPSWPPNNTGVANTIEILPCLNYPDDDVIAIHAARKIAAATRDTTGMQTLSFLYRDQIGAAIRRLADTQTRLGPQLPRNNVEGDWLGRV